MKRGKKLILLLLVLLVLCALIWGITKLTAEEELEDAAESGETIFALGEEAPASITWTYQEHTYCFENTGDSWVYSDDTAYPLDESYMDAILSTLSQITAEKVIEEPGTLSQYGLTDPLCSVAIDADTTLLFGNETVLGGQLYFSNGDGKVYIVDASVLDCFEYDLYDMIRRETIPDLSDITALTLTTEAETVQLTYLENSGLTYSDHYTWFREQDGGYTPVDMEAMEDLLSALATLSWNDCVDFQAQEDSLAAYGLDAPAATYELHYTITTQEDTGETDEDGNAIYETHTQTGIFTIELGDSADEENCYARLAGSSLVYLIDYDLCAELAAVTSQALLVDDVVQLDMESLEAVDITLDGVTYHVERTVTEATDADGNVTEETAWTLDGEELDIASVLETLTYLTGDNTGSTITPERSEEIRFTFHRDTEQYAAVELIFYQYDGTNCLMSLNGETTTLVSRSDVVSIIEAINALVL